MRNLITSITMRDIYTLNQASSNFSFVLQLSSSCGLAGSSSQPTGLSPLPTSLLDHKMATRIAISDADPNRSPIDPRSIHQDESNGTGMDEMPEVDVGVGSNAAKDTIRSEVRHMHGGTLLC